MVSDHLPVSRATLEADEFFTACEYDFKCASETIRFYRDKITRFLQWAQQAGMEVIDGAVVRRFFRHLVDTKHTENGRHAYLRALRTWFNFLVRRKVIATSPLKDADLRIQQTWTPPDVPPSDQLDRFFAQMRADIFPNRAKQPRFLPLRDYALVLFVAETGARRREALIAVEDLELAPGTARTVQKWRRRTYTRPLFFAPIKGVMKLYVEERAKYLRQLGREDVGALWITDDGDPLTPDAMSHLFNRIRKRYSWQGRFHPHKLRAVAATMSALNGDRTMMEIRMGWTPGSPMAKRYLDFANEMKMVSEMQYASSPLRTLARLRRRR